ncbi:MAG: PTS sugar transporter subunit IIA [Pseudomonadota bacterium]
MIGVVIVAHGGLARELLAATEHVVGALGNARAVAIHPQDDLFERQAEVDAAVAGVDRGAGVVVVTDMFGGSPSNLAMGALSRDDVEVIYGANLPLLVKLAKSRRRPLREAVEASLAAGRKYLDSAGGILAARRGATA